MKRRCNYYGREVRQAFKRARVVEVLLDAGSLGGNDLEVAATFSSDVGPPGGQGLTGYLPPVKRPQLVWRDAPAGAPLSDVDKAKLKASGFTSAPGEKAYLYAKVLNHLLDNMGHKLLEFESEPMPRLRPGELRYWSPTRARWLRCDSLSYSDVKSHQLELPDVYLVLTRLGGDGVKMFLKSADQEAAGRRCGHGLATAKEQGGMGLMCDFQPGGEDYHRSWNDFQWATRHSRGRLDATRVEISYVYNSNYMPYLKAGNMQTKKESLADISQIQPVPDADWEANVDSFMMDAREGPATTRAAVREKYREGFLSNEDFLKKGRFVRQAAWYSIIDVGHARDSSFQVTRRLLTDVALKLLRKGCDVQALENAALQDLEEAAARAISHNEVTAREDFKAKLAKARKATKGHQLVLSPVLLHNVNFFNMRVMLLVGRFLWSVQTWHSVHKTTAVQHAEQRVARATGHGEHFLRHIYRGSTFSAEEWARLGLPVVPGVLVADMGPYPDKVSGRVAPGVEQHEIPLRLASFLFHVIEARFWAYAWDRHAYPGAFAGTLAQGDDGEETCRSAEEFYSAMTLAESSADENPGGMELRREAYFMDWPINQLGFRLLAQYHFQRTGEVKQHFRREFVRVGDTASIEKTMKICRKVESRDQDPNKADPLPLYHQMTLPKTPLAARNIPHVHVPDDAFYEGLGDSVHPFRPWREMFKSEATPVPPSCALRQVMMKTRGGFPSKTHDSQKHAIGAGQALRHLMVNRRWQETGQAWQTSALKPHCLYQCRGDLSSPALPFKFLNYVFTVATTNYCARVWPADPLTGTGPGPNVCDIGLSPSKAWAWIVVTDVRLWQQVPFRYVVTDELAGQYGFLKMRIIGEPVPALLHGLLQVGRTRMLKNFANRFMRQYSTTEERDATKGKAAEEQLFRRFLINHPDIGDILAALARR